MREKTGVPLETSRTNEKREVLGTYPKVNVKADYYWDSHGKLIKWNSHVKEQRIWTNADVKIEVYSFTEQLIDNNYDFQTVQLYVNNHLISGELVNCVAKVDSTGKVTLHCKVTVGWG